MQQPLFRQIVGTKDYTWMCDNVAHPLRNHNRLLERFPGCTGVKTGYTYPAQQVLVSAALKDHREVIAVVMHTDKPGIWNDSMLLLDYGFEHPPVELATKQAATTAGIPRLRPATPTPFPQGFPKNVLFKKTGASVWKHAT